MGENKVEMGLKNVYYAIITSENETTTYETPKKLAGAVSFTQKPSSEQVNIHADDTIYFTINGATKGEGSLSLIKFPDEFKKDVLGYVTDSKNVLVEKSNTQPKAFALLFEVDGDAEKRRNVFYKCIPAKLGDTRNTKGEKVDETKEELSISFVGSKEDLYKASVTEKTNAEQYNAFFTKVYIPTFGQVL